jgi:hypothetical protein
VDGVADVELPLHLDGAGVGLVPEPGRAARLEQLPRAGAGQRGAGERRAEVLVVGQLVDARLVTGLDGGHRVITIGSPSRAQSAQNFEHTSTK